MQPSHVGLWLKNRTAALWVMALETIDGRSLLHRTDQR
jgi:hypothetical protein